MRWASERVVTDAAGRVRRVTTVVAQHPSPFARLGLALVVGLAFIITMVLLVPAILIGAVILSLFLIAHKLKLALAGAKAPNGPLDGRRNVRVIDRNHQ